MEPAECLRHTKQRPFGGPLKTARDLEGSLIGSIHNNAAVNDKENPPSCGPFRRWSISLAGKRKDADIQTRRFAASGGQVQHVRPVGQSHSFSEHFLPWERWIAVYGVEESTESAN